MFGVLGFPQYGSSCLGRRDDLQELVSFSSSVQPGKCIGKVRTHVHQTTQHVLTYVGAAEARIWD